MERFNLGLVGLLVLVLSGCASSGSKTGSMGSDNGMGAANDNEDAATYGMGMEGNSNLEAMTDDSMSESLETIIYFDFDRSELRAEYDGLINAHAANMNSNTLLTVRLEGHADERGSREYNIGLGERRAQAVRRMLLLNGVSPAQITTVSFGEERPNSYGSDENSYTQNRRVELVIN
jgi:peptidoglycan-associated lipoprotein